MYAIKHYAKVKLSRLLMNGFSKGTNSAQAGYDAGRGAINLRGGGVSEDLVFSITDYSTNGITQYYCRSMYSRVG